MDGIIALMSAEQLQKAEEQIEAGEVALLVIQALVKANELPRDTLLHRMRLSLEPDQEQILKAVLGIPEPSAEEIQPLGH